MMRKYFTDIDERLTSMEDKMGIPVEEIIGAQKGIAKITISRNKENADAIMNSNDKLMEKVSEFEEQLNFISKDMAQTNQSMVDKGIKDVIMKQQEAISLIKETELIIKNELLNMKLSMGQGGVNYQPIQNVKLDQEASKAATETPQVSDMNPGILDDFSDLEDFVGDETDSLREEEIIEKPLGEVISFNEKDQELLVEEPVVEVPVVEAPVVEEPVVEEPVVEEPVVEEVVPEKPPMPDLSNPNKIMSPEEIAALLANM